LKKLGSYAGLLPFDDANFSRLIFSIRGNLCMKLTGEKIQPK
jgi:hypothetical protein